MHALQRGAMPTCLGNYRHGLHNWGHVTGDDKAAIWVELREMQGQHCAFCEADTSAAPKHIEHFFKKGRDPSVTFYRSNLFGSCNRGASCGKHKDHGCLPYDAANLIEPDEENPEDFFLFVIDGTIAVRSGLTQIDKNRAEETLRIFNLHAKHGPLRNMRKKAIAGYVSLGEDARAMVLWRNFD